MNAIKEQEMRKFFTFTFKASCAVIVLVTASSGILAQRTTEVPPPPTHRTIIGKAQKFESKKGGFKVELPAIPTMGTLTVDSSFGKNVMTTYSLETTVASYAITYFDFPTELNDKFDLNTRYDVMRDAQAKKMSARVVRDEEWYFGSYFGRINTFETKTYTLSSRAVVVGPRFFELAISTRGKLSQQSGKVKKYNQEQIDRFFNSFEITEVAKPALAAVELPADFGVKLDGNTFLSTFFGVELEMPENWLSLSEQDAGYILELGKEHVAKKDPELAAFATDKQMRSLAMFARADPKTAVNNAIMIVSAERSPYPNFLASAVGKTYAKLYVDKGEKIVVPVTDQTVNGIDFSWLETTDGKVNSRIYFANLNGVAFEISMTYKDKADLALMLRSLNSIRLSGQNTLH